MPRAFAALHKLMCVRVRGRADIYYGYGYGWVCPYEYVSECVRACVCLCACIRMTSCNSACVRVPAYVRTAVQDTHLGTRCPQNIYADMGRPSTPIPFTDRRSRIILHDIHFMLHDFFARNTMEIQHNNIKGRLPPIVLIAHTNRGHLPRRPFF